MMARRLQILFLCLLLAFTTIPTPCYAHEGKEHDKILSEVLFGSYGKNTEEKDALEALCKASYLTIDLFGEKGERKNEEHKKGEREKGKRSLKYLRDKTGVDYLPESIDALGLSSESASSHRRFTHKGWDHTYSDREIKDCGWHKRRQILLSTVSSVFGLEPEWRLRFFESESDALSKGWFPGNMVTYVRYSDRCNALAALIYYVHLLGDCEAATDSSQLYNVAALANDHDKQESIIYSLISKREGGAACYLNVIFASPINKADLRSLKDELQDIATRASAIYNSTGGLNTDEKRAEYSACATEALEVLEKYVPRMIRREDFWESAFGE